MKKFFLAFIIFPLIVNAQGKIISDDFSGKGIGFENGLSWRQVLTNAKIANKFIFVDCYATWCGPCRYMRDSIFIKQETGDFMNQHFINVKVQMDVTEIDGKETKDWYIDAAMIRDKYKVTAYPTYLFINSEGDLVYNAIGAFADASSFVAKAAKALDTDEQYFFLLEEYNKGKRDSAFISQLLKAAKNAGDKKMVTRLKKE